jgi:adenine specific DNA methylase Mod
VYVAKAITENTLFYGDNLEILRDYLIDECVDLVYLDPPFNSNRNYNVLFKDEQGLDSEAQIVAFEDTWHWGPETEHAYYRLITHGPDKVVGMITALLGFIGTNQMMAYLTMMASRLIELHRVLKPTGSLYLHCDPTASHYLKLILDTIFGSQNYRNEIIWHYGQRTAFHNNHFSRKHDVILFYAKSSNAILNPVATPWMREEFLTHRHDVKVDENGKEFIWTDGGKPGVRYKRYVEDVLKEGKPLDSVWDIPLLNSSSKERLACR